MSEKAILFDTTKCIACRACQIACKQWWELPANATINRGTYENPPEMSPENWNKIRFREGGRDGPPTWLFTRKACMHCTEAVCVWVCPTYARGYDEAGYVTIDQERCIGCGRCEEYCPFGVPRLGENPVSQRINLELSPVRKVAYNCLFCKDRVEDGLSPACVKTCPTGALQFGDRADLVKQGRARVDAMKASFPKTRLYGEKELGGLHAMYILAAEPEVHGLPDNPGLGAYPEFDGTTFPDWYIQAVADGKLSVFPEEARAEWYLQPDLVPAPAPPPPAWPIPPSRPTPGWVAKASMGWIALGVLGGAAALWWNARRRMALAKAKKQPETIISQRR